MPEFNDTYLQKLNLRRNWEMRGSALSRSYVLFRHFFCWFPDNKKEFKKPFDWRDGKLFEHCSHSNVVKGLAVEEIRNVLFQHGDTLLFEIDGGARTICLRNCRTNYEIQVDNIVQTRYKFGTLTKKQNRFRIFMK